jgi:hypothetical protein
MRLEQFEAHLNELLHDVSSPLNSMRLQIGLLREEVKGDDRLLKRVDSTERQLLRSQLIIDTFVAACAVKKGRTAVEPVVRRVFDRFGFPMTDASGAVEVGLRESAFSAILRNLATGCLAFMKAEAPRAMVSANTDTLVIRVQGAFDQGTVARALRLSYVGDDGEPLVALAATRLGAAAANGALLLERDALVLRLPLVKE